ncbi:phenylalanine--tRNA ligase beta subunit-related protein [Metabacillus idriensis]|uniref:B3/B4 domain-containing protein n=1 Tax=Metabacillus idriensis TaxID=324768 RepID=UPI00203AF567|nr:phenylalanine--tRNA ligase beta subunit-related protein [Metabacillus idriensis]MCM3595597.1 phenylalanine--tRNA ligase beta subunit-related protein [Metabacillus idriensis]
MEISINPEIKQHFPDFKLGVIKYTSISVSESPQMLKGRMRLFQESIFFEMENKKVQDLKPIGEWRSIFKTLGTDPGRYRPSSEALYRRIQKQQYLEPIHSAVDLNNFFSLQHQIPFGIYDADKLSGNIEIRVGKEADVYMAINGRDVSMNGKLLSSDDTGPFGSPYVDSKRTAVTEETTNALHLIYLQPSMDDENAEEMLSSLTKMFIQIHGGDGLYRLVK